MVVSQLQLQLEQEQEQEQEVVVVVEVEVVCGITPASLHLSLPPPTLANPSGTMITPPSGTTPTTHHPQVRFRLLCICSFVFTILFPAAQALHISQRSKS